jgi:hypothetical protein
MDGQMGRVADRSRNILPNPGSALQLDAGTRQRVETTEANPDVARQRVLGSGSFKFENEGGGGVNAGGTGKIEPGGTNIPNILFSWGNETNWNL